MTNICEAELVVVHVLSPIIHIINFNFVCNSRRYGASQSTMCNIMRR